MKKVKLRLFLLWKVILLISVISFPLLVILGSSTKWSVAEDALNSDGSQVLILTGKSAGAKAIIDGKLDLSNYFESRTYILYPNVLLEPHAYVVTQAHNQEPEVEIIYWGALYDVATYLLFVYLLYYFWLRKKIKSFLSSYINK